jgi:hypothetical protein
LNGVEITAIGDDLTGGPPPLVNLVAVGDLFYKRDLADRVTAFLDRSRTGEAHAVQSTEAAGVHQAAWWRSGGVARKRQGATISDPGDRMDYHPFLTRPR